jgi:hypothetical protein
MAALAGVCVLAARTAYCLQHLVQKDQGKDMLLIEGLVRVELQRRAAEMGRRLRKKLLQGFP